MFNETAPSNSTYSGCSNSVFDSISIVQVMDEGPYCCVVSNECGNNITRCTCVGCVVNGLNYWKMLNCPTNKQNS